MDKSTVIHIIRALDKREYLVIIRDNFCQFCMITYVVTPYLNRLAETVQMRGHIPSQHIVLMRNKKNYPSVIIKHSSYLELCHINIQQGEGQHAAINIHGIPHMLTTGIF